MIIPSYEELEQSVALSKIHKCGFEYNDFWSPKVYNDEAEVQRRIDTYRRLERDRSRDTLHGVFLDIAVASTDPNIKAYSWKRVEQSMEIAKELGVRGVIFHTGLIASLNLDYYVQGWLQEEEALIRTLVNRYPGIEIYMENTFELEPDLLIQLAERLKDVQEFGLCLDYAHAVLTKTPVEEWVQKMAPYVKHIHLNDNDLKSDLHQAPGDGKIDYVQYKELIKKYEIHLPALLELNGIEKQKRALKYMNAL